MGQRLKGILEEVLFINWGKVLQVEEIVYTYLFVMFEEFWEIQCGQS